MQQPERGPSVRVVDRELLAKVVRESVGARGRTQREAANRLEIHVGHYNRLVRGQVGQTIRHKLYVAIRSWLNPEQEDQLNRAVLAEEAYAIRDAYGDWLADELQIVDWGHKGRAAFASPLEVTPRTLTPTHRQAERRSERLRAYVNTLAALCRHPVYGPHLNGFITWAEQERGYTRDGLGHRHVRLELALVRIITPLIAVRETKGVERDWSDLDTTGDAARYLRAAVTRERILMNRPPDLPRIQQLAGKRQTAGKATRQRRRKG